VLAQPGGHAGELGRAGEERAQQRVHGAERRAVGHVHGQARGLPAGVAREQLAEQLHVVVVGAKNPLVERLLGRPHRGRRGARKSAAGDSPQFHQRAA
jgi:hypothetical protein